MRSKRYAPHILRSGVAEGKTQIRPCDRAGCAGAGEYRAPKGRDDLTSYYWFCLDHVREYNAGWDYYRNMSPEEIEAALRADATWQRATWPMGAKATLYHHPFQAVKDDIGIFTNHAKAQAARRFSPQENDALAIMQIVPPFTAQSLKTRYKELVKLYHPDANGGSKEAEERFKKITQAYKTLKDSLDTP